MNTKPDNKPPLKKVRKINGANFPARRIPPNVLKRTLEITSNPEDGFWLNKNTSCAPPISYELYSKPGDVKKIVIKNFKGMFRLYLNSFLLRDVNFCP